MGAGIVEQDLGKLADEFKAKVDQVYGALAERVKALEGDHAAMRAAYGDVVTELEAFIGKVDGAFNDIKIVLARATALQTTPASSAPVTVPAGVVMSTTQADTATPPA